MVCSGESINRVALLRTNRATFRESKPTEKSADLRLWCVSLSPLENPRKLAHFLCFLCAAASPGSKGAENRWNPLKIGSYINCCVFDSSVGLFFRFSLLFSRFFDGQKKLSARSERVKSVDVHPSEVRKTAKNAQKKMILFNFMCAEMHSFFLIFAVFCNFLCMCSRGC